MPFASVNGQQLYFEDTTGNGPVVVFSHGNLMNRDMWAAQVEALHGEFRCVVWDERLHGSTKDDGGLYTYWDAADDVLGLFISVSSRRLWSATPRAASCRFVRPCSRPNGSRPWSWPTLRRRPGRRPDPSRPGERPLAAFLRQSA